MTTTTNYRGFAFESNSEIRDESTEDYDRIIIMKYS